MAKKLTELPRKVYHGTIEYYLESLESGIDLDWCSKFTDFARGFYTTSNFRQAAKLAKDLAKAHNQSELDKKQEHSYYNIQLTRPLVIEYRVNTYRLKQLVGEIFQLPDVKWAEFVYNNRKRSYERFSDFHNWDARFDYVYGHLADGKLVNVMKKFEDDPKYDLEQFTLEVQPRFPYRDDQLSFHTYEAIQCLRREKEVSWDVDTQGIATN